MLRSYPNLDKLDLDCHVTDIEVKTTSLCSVKVACQSGEGIYLSFPETSKMS